MVAYQSSVCRTAFLTRRSGRKRVSPTFLASILKSVLSSTERVGCREMIVPGDWNRCSRSEHGDACPMRPGERTSPHHRQFLCRHFVTGTIQPSLWARALWLGDRHRFCPRNTGYTRRKPVHLTTPRRLRIEIPARGGAANSETRKIDRDPQFANFMKLTPMATAGLNAPPLMPPTENAPHHDREANRQSVKGVVLRPLRRRHV